MTKWQEVRLGDICIQITDGTHNTVKDCESGDCYLLSCKNIKNGNIEIGKNERKIDRHTLEELRKRTKTAKGDVLLSSVGTIGETAVIKLENPNYEFQRSVAIFKPNLNFITSEFLYYSLNSRKDILQHSAEGAVQQCLFINPLKDFSISLPPLEIQKKIAGVLGALDDKIELNNKINNNLEQQAQALFKSWFVDFEPFGGEMPDDWKIGKLEDVVDVIMGQSPSGNSYNEKGRGCIFFQGRAEFGFRFPTIKLFTTEPRRMARQNDILMSVRAPVGDVNVAHEDCCIGRGLCAIRSKDNFQSFIFYTLWSVQNKLNIFNGEGTVFGSINKDSLNNLEIIVPNSNTIQKFENLCSPMDNLIRKNYEENTRLSALRDTLLPKLMSGEVDVSKVDISALTSADKLSFTGV